MPWDPVRDLLTMQERLESLFSRASPGWVPPVDLAEFDDRYAISIELPGLARSDVALEFADMVLTVRGIRPPQACPERYHQLERGQGQFARSVRFAAPVLPDAITAEFTDGVLLVTIPKAATDRRRIDVS
ncbi:MAG: Hsp20/alpha crystallin family protein [Acidobacteriota bacterium]